MKLRYDDALGTVNNKRTVVRHQRDLAKEYILFLNVADRRDISLGIFVIDGQTDLDLERDAVRHAALLTLLLIVLVLEADRFTAVVAEIRTDGVERAAIFTKHFGGVKRVNLYLGRAILTVCT